MSRHMFGILFVTLFPAMVTYDIIVNDEPWLFPLCVCVRGRGEGCSCS